MSDGLTYTGRRDPRFVTVRRGGSLEDDQHRMLAAWAADCAEHVLDLFSETHPDDHRPRHAVEQARAWSRGEISMMKAREAAYAIRAARTASPTDKRDEAGRLECRWQRARLPDAIRDLVLSDQERCNHKLWSLFDC